MFASYYNPIFAANVFIMKESIAIDMDGVLADVEAQFISWYHEEYGVLVDRSNFLGVPEAEAFPDKGALHRYVASAGFFRTVPLMPGAVEAVKKLMEKYEVFVVSAAMEYPLSLAEKHEWLSLHFPFISWRNIVFCGSKAIIDTNYLIDDHLKNLDHCKGKPIMFTAGHNINHQGHIRVNNWEEVLALFEKGFD